MADYPPEHTVCLLSVPKTLLARVRDAINRETSTINITESPDKVPTRAGQYLVYANYVSGRDALKAREILRAWVVDKWPAEHYAARPVVERLSDMNNPVYFALHVANTPPGTTVAELERLFEQYGPLHANPRVRALDDGTFFVNFVSFAGAEAALEAACTGSLRVHGTVPVANAARNTMFINELITTMRQTGQYSFSLHDAKRVGEQMKKNAPCPTIIRSLIKAVPSYFAVDRMNKLKFNLIDGSAPAAPQAPRVSAGPPQSLPRPSSPALTEEEDPSLTSVGSASSSSSSTSAEVDGPTNSTAPSTGAAVEAWLKSICLQNYTAVIVEYGYDSLKALDSASEDEVKEMTKAIAMKKPHQSLLINEWKKLKNQQA
jgi:hypothetical protein